jgi:eukaryotic-like serine/threonine-protein kinase
VNIRLGRADLALQARRGAEQLVPRTGWEHYALGRSLLRAGELDAAAAELRRAVALQPRDLWANFYDGVGALRRKRYDDAVTAFTACVALAPRDAQRARCFYNRALAFTKLRRPDRALGDYDWALKLDPSLAQALLNRGILHYEQNRFPAALADLRRALEKGAPPVLVHYNLALVHRALGNRDDALASVQQALRHDPGHAAAGARG